MTKDQIEAIIGKAVEQLNRDVRESRKHNDPLKFQDRVLRVLQDVAAEQGVEVTPSFHPHAFPDIRANGFGIEVKSVKNDSWLSVGNSVFEGMRDREVEEIYVIFGKLGGMPAVKWGKYEERITHVRISHAPRFVLEMDRDASLFEKMDVPYEKFAKFQPDEKMRYIRDYSRGRLQPGERLWWLEDENSPGIELEIRLYMKLPPDEKVRLRAEGAIVCPQIVGGGREKEKYNDVAFYLLRHHNVFAPQTRDLYSAGSVAGKERGGNYVLRALQNIEATMREVAPTIPAEVIEEYWGSPVAPEDRIRVWLEKADGFAKDWVPSRHLFTEQGNAPVNLFPPNT